ncbi:MAG: membrane protein insertase YidC [Bryobacteraceae bacterium]|jgi:YidC/Oxa1 family membrane protein insertase
MAESGNGGSPKEMSMEVRLLLAFLLMGAVMFLTPYFYKTPPPAKNAQKTTEAQNEPGQAPAAPAATETAVPNAPPAPSAPTEPATVAVSLPPVTINTNLFSVTFDNQGATVRHWQLKKYKGNDNKPLDLVNPAVGSSDVPFPFSLYVAGQPPTAKVNQVYYTESPDADGLGIAFGYSDGHTNVRKTFRFQRDSYLCEVSSVVTVDQRPLAHAIEWRGGFGDLTVSNAASKESTLYFNPAENKLYEQSAKVAKDGPSAATANFSFAGLEDQYFAAVFLPETGEVSTTEERPSFVATTFSDSLRTVAVEKPHPLIGAAVSLGTDNHFRLFVGPKDLDLLKSVDPKLEQVVNFGFLSILTKPLFLAVNWCHKSLVHNFGWAIVLVTVVINLALFPLRFSNMKSMRKMQALKPQIDLINAKYKKLSLTDPRKADQQQETMALYKQNGVNPMGGCLPMLIQLPFFYAFYRVFTVSVEMRGASWLWVTDLSQPETLPLHILPLIMIASQFWMQKMTPTAAPGGDPGQQKMMMYMMPLIFGFMFYNLPSGLVLYYLTSNLVGMGLQLFFNQTAAAENAVLSVEPPKKSKNRK